MPLMDNEGNTIITAHASKKSKVNLKLFEAHTSVLVPLLIIPVLPFWITVKAACFSILVLILLERRGWTLSIALKRLRTSFAGRYRFKKTRRSLQRRMNH